jgi:hypothetical protein
MTIARIELMVTGPTHKIRCVALRTYTRPATSPAVTDGPSRRCA